MKIKIFLFIFYILFSIDAYSFENKNKLLEIYKNLRCLVCQGQSIADSNSDFAVTIKLVVQDQFNEGKTEEEIYKFLTDRYGDFILLKPPLKIITFPLWFLPFFILIISIIYVFWLNKKSKKT